MTDASKGFHEPLEVLDDAVRDRHRAIASLMEELEAVDWYDQRVAGATNEELRAILAHNRDEEKEHAAMVIEWLRRNDPGFAEELATYLYADGPILKAEEAATGGNGSHGSGGNGAPSDGSLGIGSLKEER